jgi:hypothetical protein
MIMHRYAIIKSAVGELKKPQAPRSIGIMRKMHRIVRSRMLLLVRLVMVASLAFFGISNAYAAMHGSLLPELRQAAMEMDHASHHDEMASEHDEANSAQSHHDMSGDKADDGLSKQECCKDFCGGLGIVSDAVEIGGPIVSAIREFSDDKRQFGELSYVDRPPSI